MTAAQQPLFSAEAELQDVITTDYDHGAPGDRLRIAVEVTGEHVLLFPLDARGNRKSKGIKLSPTLAGCLGSGLLMARKRAFELADARRGRR